MGKSGVNHPRLILPVPALPYRYRPVLQGALLPDGSRPVHRHHAAQALATGTCPLPGVVGELRAGELVHPHPAAAAVHIDLKLPVPLFGLLPAVGGRDKLPAVGTSANAQLLVHHAQLGIEVGGGAHGGARVAVGRPALRDQDGRGQPPYRAHPGPADALPAHGLQVLPLTLLVEEVHRQGGLARPGHTGEDHQFVPGDVHGEVPQIALPGVLNVDPLRHTLPPFLSPV